MPDADELAGPRGQNASGQLTPKERVMIYVPRALHHAVKRLAVHDWCSMSDVYVEAARALLTTRGVPADENPGHPDPATVPPAPTMADLVAALDRKGQRIEEIHGSIAAGGIPAPQGGMALAGTKSAEAMKAILQTVKEAGSAGMSGRDLGAAVYAMGIRSGAAETAKSVLRAAGLVRCEKKRWFVPET